MQNISHTFKLISLGCPKNLVDSEAIGGILQKEGYQLRSSSDISSIAIINTCGFIEASKQESIDTILEIAEEKKKGALKVLVVTGCLSQRYKDDISKQLPEVDAFVGTGDFSSIPEIIKKKLNGDKKRNFIRSPDELILASTPRIEATPSYSKYIKISEGCSHKCSFCTIPSMRGGLKSRTIDDVLVEMKAGIDNGVKEFNMIGQDLNEYGRDLEKRESLYNLLNKAQTLAGDYWIRLLYMYPLQFPDKLIQLIKDSPNICPYVDIPLQHINDRILKSMNRGSSSAYIYRLLENLKKQIPNIVLRTTFIVGYPGETDSEFGELLNFIKEIQFDRLGAFTYSDEEGTPAFGLNNKNSPEVAAWRKNILMEAQQKVSLEKNRKLVGQNLKVLIEGSKDLYEGENDLTGVSAIGRYYGQAPQIDGQIMIKGNEFIDELAGQFASIQIDQATRYDLVGTLSQAGILNSAKD